MSSNLFVATAAQKLKTQVCRSSAFGYGLGAFTRASTRLADSHQLWRTLCWSIGGPAYCNFSQLSTIIRSHRRP